ncbi:GNAT family N-acetyltransferase [Thermomicrobiaceae bacterium CFH 74404]|uniref:GNAT family N-acetyltransferase n=1 Tax=Thermalbibacter longus TaxID=2951981 RepID=A0AA41WD46_9BACT|nr:GNAT family N-acetyltransferase [Thermalbibacter longus]MCM8749797.1 GNAT family N-acetyltransferase [Thermalbibacter longus]
MEELLGIEITVRHDLRPGDLGRVTEMHGLVYAREYAFDHTFEAYVAATLGEFGQQYRPGRDRLWLAEQGDRLVGSIAIVGRSEDTAQLRWFLVLPSCRGYGLGSRLLAHSLSFCRSAGYRHVYLWTVHPLENAARLYRRFGFRLTEELPEKPLWDHQLREQRYDLELADDSDDRPRGR